MMAHISGDALGLFPGETEPYRGITGGSLVWQNGYDGKAKADYFGSYQWLIARVLPGQPERVVRNGECYT